ncbi:MAG: hypothetical protein FWC16_09185 [Defluviitaleaceae bacterium]|nr:hypothetical protein [Defluviitaleaceae bacterium]MCL2275084.1 hypothetical protein [Defluviitaleaceae bacterium]
MMTIIKHYLKRSLIEPIGIAIYIVAPLVFVGLIAVMNQYNIEEGAITLMANGTDLNVGNNLVINMLMFQFMGILLVVDPLFRDLKYDMRWRLLSAPVPSVKFVFGCMWGHYVFALAAGALLLIGGFFMNSYMFNPFVLAAALALVALIAMLFGTLFFYLFKKMAIPNTLGTVISFGMSILFGVMVSVDLPTPLHYFGQYGTPFAWALRAIIYSSEEASAILSSPNITMFETFDGGMTGVMMNLGFLAAFAAVLAVIVVIVSRRKAI